MADVRNEIDYDAIFQEVMSMPSVLAKVEQKAVNIAAKARAIDAAEGSNAMITVRRVHVPSGRAIYNVESTDVAGEYGDSTTAARKTLRRAAGGSRR